MDPVVIFYIYSTSTIYDLQPYGKIANTRRDDDKEELKIRSYKSSVWVKKKQHDVFGMVSEREMPEEFWVYPQKLYE